MGEQPPTRWLVEGACIIVPGSFETFFQATAGADAAFVGLLFIAISISPQRTFDPHAVAGVQHQRLAEATLLSLVNGFVVSCVALVPDVNVGWIALVLGGACVLIAASSSGSWPVPTGTSSQAVRLGCTDCASSV